MLIGKLFNPLLILIIIVFLFLSTSLLLDEPFVWPDEAIYGDIARNIMLEGRLGTDLLKGLINGIENHAYWIPPLFMYANALWFQFFGFSIVTQRLFSVFLGGLFLVVFYQVVKTFISSKKSYLNYFLPLVAVLFLAVDSTFLKSSRLSRPEMMVLLLTITALLFFKQILTLKSNKQYPFLVISGFLLGLAIISHLIAISFITAFGLHLVYLYWKKNINFRGFLIFLLAFSGPVICWLLSIYPNYNLLTDQLGIISKSRNYTLPWYVNVSNFPFLIKINYFIYISTSLFFILFTYKNRKPPYILLSLILISVWIFITLGEIYWYTIYPLPFVYLALIILINHIFNNSSKDLLSKLAKAFLVFISIFLIYSNLSDYFRLLNSYKNNSAYNLFIKQIREAVPQDKTVFLTSIPDAYYAFEKGRNKLYEYPAFFADREDFKKVLDQSDYIIFSSFFSPDPISLYLDQYMTKNLESIKELSSPYHTLIIRLKDRGARLEVK